MINSQLFDSCVRLLSDPTLRQLHGHDVVILLTLLVNYRKNESANPYIVQLSILADELALNGYESAVLHFGLQITRISVSFCFFFFFLRSRFDSYGQMISSSLIDFCRQYTQNLNEMHSSSWLSSLSNIVGNMFVSDEDCDRVQQIRANNALLLALYEAVHLNRNFITTLSHTHETSSPPSPSNTLNANQPTPDLASAPTTPTALDVASQYPTNLLVAMFQYWLVFYSNFHIERKDNPITKVK